MKLSFFGSVKNDWGHAREMLKTIESFFWFASKEIVLVDDNSNETEVERARCLEGEHSAISIVFNSQHRGIVPCLNQAIDKLAGNIAIPIAADMEYICRLLPFTLIYAFIFRRADFLFAKTIHIDAESKNKTGVTGWAISKGMQCEKSAIENFISGQTRPSGAAVAYRTEVLKNYKYDPSLGPLSDFYLNNLMILKHRAYYYKKVVSRTLERRHSYSNSFTQSEALALVEKTIVKFESDGVILTDAQKNQYRAYERSQWPD